MLKNYLTVGFRTLLKHKAYALINVFGLAVGMACCLLIGLYLRDELRYDRFHENADRIYRVSADWQGSPFSTSSMRLAPALAAEVPEVQAVTRIYPVGFMLSRGAEGFQEQGIYFADSTFFSVFDFPLLAGMPEAALSRPNSIVLTQKTAKKYFGTADPMGQTLRADNEHLFTVTGIVQDVPEQSHLQFEGLVSMRTAEALLPPGIWADWFWTESYTYVLLDQPSGGAVLQDRLPDFADRQMGALREETGQYYDLFLEPLMNLYLRSDAELPIGPVGHQDNLYLFAVIAVFILVIACVNFINLATAQATERAKEVGVRKAIGAGRWQLARQFLAESVVISVAALLLALLITELALPGLRTLSGKMLPGDVLLQPLVGVALLIWAVLVGMLASLYPALVLSRFQPIQVLKGRRGSITEGAALRKGLVVFQFSLSIMLIAGTLVVYTQVRYLQNQSLGFEKEQMLVVDYADDQAVQRDQERIKQALLRHPAVRSATFTSDVPGTNRNSARTVYEDPQGAMTVGFSKLYFVDQDFVDHFGIELIAGRAFGPEHTADTTTGHAGMLVNERAVRVFGYDDPGAIIGKSFSQWGVEGTIVGVVKDFHFKSLHERIRPLSLRIDPSETRFLTLQLQAEDLPATLAALAAVWQAVVPHRPFDYNFLNERLDRLYHAETRFGQLFVVFALLAILLAGLGLFGVASFTIQRRTKEIGIRKVVGASATQIVLLLSRDYLWLVGGAFVLAVPLASWGLWTWLAGFAYHTEMPWHVFLWAGLIALVVALATVSHQARKAAIANPVETLRYE